MNATSLERAVLGGLAGLAVFALAACVAFTCHAAVAAWWLPAAIAFGVLAVGPAAPWPSATPAHRGLVAAVVVALAAALVAVAYGALATPSRHWDGAVAWDTAAHFLAAGLSLEHPYFRDPAVLAYTRDYPPLQPLLVATLVHGGGPTAGRVVFPLLYALLGLLVFVRVRRAGGDGNLPWLAAAGVLLVPTLTSPGGGGVDSGYGDALLLLATTAITAGLWQRHVVLLAGGAVLAVLAKPEGLVYAGAATAVAFVVGDRRCAVAAAAGWLGAAARWLPLQRELVTPGLVANGLADAAVAILGIAAVAGAATVATRRAWRWRARLVLLAAAGGLVAVAFVCVAPGLPAGGALHAFVDSPGRLLTRLDRVPALALGLCNHALLRGGCGLAFWSLVVAAPLLWRRRADLAAPAAFVLAGLCIVPLPFLLGPEPDLQHHLRSSLGRLLLHWTGPALLVATAALAGDATVPPPWQRRPADPCGLASR